MIKLTILLTCLAFSFAPTLARAESAPRALTESVTTSPPRLPVPAPINNLSGDYQKREAANPLLASFQGGGSAVYIGGGAVTVLLIVLLVVLIIK
jgi:hypothetical protein